MLDYMMSKTSISYSIEMGTSMHIIPDFTNNPEKSRTPGSNFQHFTETSREKNVKLKLQQKKRNYTSSILDKLSCKRLLIHCKISFLPTKYALSIIPLLDAIVLHCFLLLPQECSTS